MQVHVSPTVMILGANGRFGRVAVDAFSSAGWHVIAQSRSAPLQPLPRNTTSLLCDALDTNSLIGACAGNVEVIINGLNPAYTEWDQRVAPLTKSVLELARATGALLMVPGNVYNFGSELPEVLAEETPQVPNTSKARVRIELERQMRLAATQGVRSVVIRAGDFLGGPGPGTWIDMVIAKKLHRQEVTYLGPVDVPHAWAYLPDLARVFVAVAEHRDELQPFDVFHYSGLTLTGLELVNALEHTMGRKFRLRQMPWWLLRLVSPLAPMCRALLEMRYLWQRPHRLNDAKLVALIGDMPRTAIGQALQDSLPTGGMERSGVGRAEGHAVHT